MQHLVCLKICCCNFTFPD